MCNNINFLTKLKLLISNLLIEFTMSYTYTIDNFF